MRGVVLAAGQGVRLRPDTDNLPKTLLPVDGDVTILDIALRNLAAVSVDRVGVVVGYAADAIAERHADLEKRHGVTIDLIPNDRPDWNNCYSLWHAREYFASGALLVNGDTVHPRSVEKTLLSQPDSGIMLATDAVKELTDEAMKLRADDDGVVSTITKNMPVADAFGEYIGVSRISAGIAPQLTAALEETFQRNPQLYYEDAFQLLADAGPAITAVPIGSTEWVEVDNHDDWAEAREVACRC